MFTKHPKMRLQPGATLGGVGAPEVRSAQADEELAPKVNPGRSRELPGRSPVTRKRRTSGIS